MTYRTRNEAKAAAARINAARGTDEVFAIPSTTSRRWILVTIPSE